MDGVFLCSDDASLKKRLAKSLEQSGDSAAYKTFTMHTTAHIASFISKPNTNPPRNVL